MKFAVPPFNFSVSWDGAVLSTETCTDPVGVALPEPGDTVTLNDIEPLAPAFTEAGDTLRAVVVGAGLIVCVSTIDVLLALVASPL